MTIFRLLGFLFPLPLEGGVCVLLWEVEKALLARQGALVLFLIMYICLKCLSESEPCGLEVNKPIAHLNDSLGCHHNICENPWSWLFNSNAELLTHFVFFVLTQIFHWRTQTQNTHMLYSPPAFCLSIKKEKLLTIHTVVWVIRIATLGKSMFFCCCGLAPTMLM